MSHSLEDHPQASNLASLSDLAVDLDSIYNTYATHTGNNSTDTLDSDKDRAPREPSSYTRYRQQQREMINQSTTQQFLSDFDYDEPSSNINSNSNSHSNLPSQSQSSTGSFDFSSAQLRPSGLGNSSLNVLVSNSTAAINHSEHEHEHDPDHDHTFNGGEQAGDVSSDDEAEEEEEEEEHGYDETQNLTPVLPPVSPKAPPPPPPSRKVAQKVYLEQQHAPSPLQQSRQGAPRDYDVKDEKPQIPSVVTSSPSTPLLPSDPAPVIRTPNSLAPVSTPEIASSSPTPPPTSSHQNSQLSVKSSDEWAAVKKVEDPEDSSKYKIVRRTVQDFKFGKSLGEGSYSTVVLATDKHTQQKYAVKILDKRHIIKEKKVKYVNIEKHALNRLVDRVGIISLFFTFQDKHSLYFVLDYASNGELLTLIKKYGTLNEDCTRYYCAQLLDAIKYMHDNGVIHRDIKPENILLDDRMRLQITDFGTARLLEKKGRANNGSSANGSDENDSEDYPVDVRAKSFVGTAEYVSPELLESKYCGKPGDIWAFGCIVYQMIAGKPPFKGSNEYQTFQKITKLQYAFSAGFPVVIRDLLKQILVLQPSRRANIATIQQHYFFQSVDWDDFDSIWETKHPELGPYKMNAKAMTKIPDLIKTASQQSVYQHTSKPPASRSSNSSANLAAKNKRVAASDKSKVNAASVAAYVLHKNGDEISGTDDGGDGDNEEDTTVGSTSTSSSAGGKSASRPGTSRKATSTSTSSKQRPAADYIPGTNILRPTVNSQAIRTLTSSSRKSQSQSSSSSSSTSTKPKSKVMEVTPLSPVEIAWGSYLKHSDERVLKIGPVKGHKQSTESFERKNKGLLHDSPLGWYGSKQLGGTARQSPSLLTQVANGSNVGLRSQQAQPHAVPANTSSEDYDEDSCIIDHFAMTAPPKRSASSASTSSSNEKNGGGSNSAMKNSKSFLFKKLLLSSHHGNSNGNDNDSNTTPHPLERQRTCTMLITTHGRVLIFHRDEDFTNSTLVTEIKLSAPIIQFKEVISSGSTSKFSSKVIPTLGIFAIESNVTTFVFEVERYDVIGWTEALAKAKNNQIERENEQYQQLHSHPPIPQAAEALTPVKLVDPPAAKPKAAAPSSGNESSHQHGHQQTSSTSHSAPYNSTRITSGGGGGGVGSQPTRTKPSEPSHAKESGNGSSLFAARSSKSTKRKPPPSVYPTAQGSGHVDMSTGLGTNSGSVENGTLYAAQLAVSNNQKNRPQSDYKQRSSFSKSDGTGHRTSQSGSSSTEGNRAAKAVTTLNSKFLSRSQRRK